MLRTIFSKENGFVIPQINEEALWVFTRPSLAQRLYWGKTVELKRHWYGTKYWSEDVGSAAELPPMDQDYLGFGKYKVGKYRLVDKADGLRAPRLIMLSKAEQLGDINQLEIHLNEDIEDVFYSLARSLLHAPIRGVVFRDRQANNIAKLERKDFDWDGIAQSSRGADYGLSSLSNWKNYEGQTKAV